MEENKKGIIRKAAILMIIALALFLASCEQLGIGVASKNNSVPYPSEIRQWAVRATASSSFASLQSESKEDQSPTAATGEPDVAECGSYKFEKFAWAPAQEDGGIQWLALTYNEGVFVSAVNIREASPSGAIVQVDLKDDSGAYHTVWEGKDPVRKCPGYLEVTLLNMTMYRANEVKVYVDTNIPGWNMIDAAELVGYERRWYILNNTLVME